MQQLGQLDTAMLVQEKSLAEAAYYLPSFDQKRCTVTVQVRDMTQSTETQKHIEDCA
jgi:hypothetical protein